jgi:ATP-dependent Clp protease ATP-binding subunit ClpC
MFERFTDRARRVVVLAQEEARRLNHNYIGTEHLLLGMIREGEGVAARALSSMGISLDHARREVESVIGRGDHPQAGHIPFTPRSKKVLELSLRESQQLGHHYIGTEHLLLGMVREGEGVAAQVLVKLGAELDRVREQVIESLREGEGEATAEPGPPPAGIHAFGPGEQPPGAGPVRAQLSHVMARLDEVMTRLDGIDRRLSDIERGQGVTGPARPAEPGAQRAQAPRGGPSDPADEAGPPGAEEGEAPGGEQAG